MSDLKLATSELRFTCGLCGCECSGYEVEMNLGKDILCLSCIKATEEWSRSLRGME